MPRRVALPPHLGRGPFGVGEGRSAGLGEKRMRGRDLFAPFPSTRLPLSTPLDLQTRCRAYSSRLRADEVFSHVTAARLWGLPLETEWTELEPVHVSIPAPGRAVR